MQAKIRGFIEQRFLSAPKTKRMEDLKEELYANLCDKYEDHFSKGKSEEESFALAIESLGDVDELIKRFSENAEPEESRKKTALVVAGCVGLYIFSIIAMLIANEATRNSRIGFLVFLTIAGAATCVLVYHFISKPRYYKRDDSLLEKVKEWESRTERKREIYKSVSGILWLLIVVLYMLISFTFGGWHITWIIFLVGAALQNILKLMMDVKDEHGAKK